MPCPNWSSTSAASWPKCSTGSPPAGWSRSAARDQADPSARPPPLDLLDRREAGGPVPLASFDPDRHACDHWLETQVVRLLVAIAALDPGTPTSADTV
ncbi:MULTISPECIES: hypothetical protein [unclassified Frankia]|uniref:hypothetical protein n=1 Tax=unclassified Frankia TaxID=2632575 RepID=UPI002AD20372|nr:MULTISPECIES: hypothetical protein [unclassified Frankia]